METMMPGMKWQDYIKDYVCTSEHNTSLHAHFTKMTESVGELMKHRLHIENNKLGFGDRAFHYMWSLLLEDLMAKRGKPSLLEIGVFKGQVISLWSILTKLHKGSVTISCITPLAGNVPPTSTLTFYWKLLTDSKFRKDAKSGNFYKNEDYLQIIKELFKAFELNFNDVRVHKGYSTDKTILSQISNEMFDLVYIDGDHTREVAEADIRNFSNKIFPGGYLIMDDASRNIPGAENGEYWKGHQSVSDACEIIPALGFVNVLNVGHNRVYQKV